MLQLLSLREASRSVHKKMLFVDKYLFSAFLSPLVRCGHLFFSCYCSNTKIELLIFVLIFFN